MLRHGIREETLVCPATHLSHMHNNSPKWIYQSAAAIHVFFSKRVEAMFFSKVLHVHKRVRGPSSGSGLLHVGCVTEAFPLLTPSNCDTSWVFYNSVLTLITRRLRLRGKGSVPKDCRHFRHQSQVLGSQVIHTFVLQTWLQSRGFPLPTSPASDLIIY